ncbi:4-(cytidine 5'-diphospho)-2-C-methyl-D-erythritol kinase [Ruficoccus amylovorans]|uniref:4-diphosphocytidyl-2-C-methyl-D-erythritol kinase n=1 Tax=Ruficoccus amylovorans TaxID=1804625 RepID=A0A842HD90_9BACT|nr:4-(cytidine 5'-diphospho)-2-C-methyl-D-erythritol kinase [Ruficoccus amylovorans]MBC2593656.1 4-(cytidine 5'-diphospho)-2-C-methyl-D-erythritol kinase [Ruficoccus amylovorans]
MSAEKLTLSAPAKVNLLLAITGMRADGFHDLVSVVAPLAFGDTLETAYDPAGEADSLRCDMPGVPLDESNLVLKAAQLFRGKTGVKGAFSFDLDKRIPHGAGLGGGSSDGASALRAMNRLTGEPLKESELAALAAELGSDCPLFLQEGPVVMRGRGEHIEPLTGKAAEALRGVGLLVFKPPFGVATGWAYGRMKARGDVYAETARIEAGLAEWQAAPELDKFPFYNNMQTVAFEKYRALPVLLEQLRADFGLTCLMSGSGSACFALIDGLEPEKLSTVRGAISAAWGPQAFIQATSTL